MEGFTNETISALARLHTPNFRGVYSCQDILTVRPMPNTSLIVNAALSRESAGHFVVLMFQRNPRKVCFFDPTGLSFSLFDHIREYVDTFNLSVIDESTVAVQNILFSSFCGIYCVTKLWLKNHFPHVNYLTFFNSKETMENDVTVLGLLKALHAKLI